MSLTKLSKIAWTDGGSYEDGKSYVQLTLVTYNGETWLNLVDGNNKAPSEENGWKKVTKAFTFEDFTDEEIALLQKPATDAANDAEEKMSDIQNDYDTNVKADYQQNVKGEVTHLSSDIATLHETILEKAEVTEEVTDNDVRVASTPNYVIGQNGTPSSSSGYTLFTFVADKDYKVWFTSAQKVKFPSFLAISTKKVDGTYTPRKRYIANSEDALPTEDNPLLLEQGVTLYVNTKTNEYSASGKVGWMIGFEGDDTLNGHLPLANAHIKQVLNSTGDMFVNKTNACMTVFMANKKGSFIAYPLFKRYRAYTEGEYPSFFDNWGIEKVEEYIYANGVMSKKVQLFQDGEAELAINLPRNGSTLNVYVGGSAHGFENIVTGDNGREIMMFVDNVQVGEGDELALKPCSKIEVYQHSQMCQAYSNAHPFADVTKKWVFESGEVSITTNVKILRNVSLHQSQFGMMCVYRRLGGVSTNPYLTNKALKDSTPYTIYDVEDNWSIPALRNVDNKANRVLEYGEYGLGFEMNIKDDNRKSNGGMFVHNNGTGAYNKIYFDLTGDYSATEGEELKATQVWSIR